MAKKRLAETQEELSAEVSNKAEKVHDLAELIGKKLAQAEQVGAEGKVRLFSSSVMLLDPYLSCLNLVLIQLIVKSCALLWPVYPFLLRFNDLGKMLVAFHLKMFYFNIKLGLEQESKISDLRVIDKP